LAHHIVKVQGGKKAEPVKASMLLDSSMDFWTQVTNHSIPSLSFILLKEVTADGLDGQLLNLIENVLATNEDTFVMFFSLGSSGLPPGRDVYY